MSALRDIEPSRSKRCDGKTVNHIFQTWGDIKTLQRPSRSGRRPCSEAGGCVGGVQQRHSFFVFKYSIMYVCMSVFSICLSVSVCLSYTYIYIILRNQATSFDGVIPSGSLPLYF